MSEIIKSSYVMPYPIEELGGELGLNSKDLAIGLHVDSYDIVQKLKRQDKNEWNSLGWDFTTNVVNSPGRGRPQHIAYMNLLE